MHIIVQQYRMPWNGRRPLQLRALHGKTPTLYGSGLVFTSDQKKCRRDRCHNYVQNIQDTVQRWKITYLRSPQICSTLNQPSCCFQYAISSSSVIVVPAITTQRRFPKLSLRANQIHHERYPNGSAIPRAGVRKRGYIAQHDDELGHDSGAIGIQLHSNICDNTLTIVCMWN